MKPNPTARVDIARRYLLPAGARVIQRAPDCVQIGTEAPRRVIVQDAPPNAVRVLCGLDGSGTVADVLNAQDADPLLWGDVLDQLLDAELLVALDPLDRSTAPILRHPQLAHERSGVAHRYGEAAANRIMQARDDAMVVVRGGSDLAGSIAAMLAAAGVGHLHLERAGSAHAPANRFAGNGARSGPVGPAELRASYPNLRVHPPAAHQRPTIVVLCGDPVPDLGLAATYTRNLIPHLPVTTGLARAVVGPLVLPGRSSCLSCADRHRTAADPGWPIVARYLAAGPRTAPTFVTGAATCLTVAEVLEHIDGVRKPHTVDGTVEWQTGDIAPRRRSWVRHPDCGCHREWTGPPAR